MSACRKGLQRREYDISKAEANGEARPVTGDKTSRLSAFTSAREGRLWLLTAAAVVAIYATLGLARTLAEELRNRGLVDAMFVVGSLLVAAAVLALALKTQIAATEIGIVLGIAAVYLMVFVRMGSPEERTHLIEYGVVAILIYEALLERARNGRGVPAPALLAVAATAVLGGLDEAIQALIPSRVFDPVDLLFNALAAVMAVAAIVALRWGRRRKLSP